MTQNSYPFADQPTTEAQYSEGFSRMQLTGVDGHPADNNLRVFGDATGMQVKAPAGFAIVRGHFYENTDEVLLELSPSDTTPRRDLVVLRLDASVDSVVLAVVEGTPAVSPSDPSLVQVPGGIWEEPVARIVVAASASTIGPNDVQDLRRFLGTQFGRWRTSTRPASPIPGTAGFNTTTGIPEFWNGSTWSAFTPTEISANIITSGTLDAARIGDGSIPDAKINSLNAGKLTAGTIPPARIGTGAINNARLADGSVSEAKIANGAVSNAKISAVDAGKVSSGVLALARIPALDASRIPNLDAGKLTSGTLPSARIGSNAITTARIGDGQVSDAKIASVGAGKVTGTLADARIPSLNASKITAGTFSDARIPSLPASRITSGSFNADRIPSLPASRITSGSFNADRIPSLPASKITSGSFSTSRIPNLSATKITSGTFSTSRIPSLSATKITSGDISRPVITTGRGRFGAAWNNNITSTRRSIWMESNGEMGHTASSRKFKKDIKDTAMKLEDVLKLRVTDFKYKANPDHVETGMIAEEVADTGLEFLVSRNEDGSPHGVHYEMLSLAVLALAQEQQKQIEALVARVEELEATDAA